MRLLTRLLFLAAAGATYIALRLYLSHEAPLVHRRSKVLSFFVRLFFLEDDDHVVNTNS